MNIRNTNVNGWAAQISLVSIMASLMLSGAAFGATEQASTAKKIEAASATQSLCTKLVRTHHGHPSKGYDVVERIVVPCAPRP